MRVDRLIFMGLLAAVVVVGAHGQSAVSAAAQTAFGRVMTTLETGSAAAQEGINGFQTVNNEAQGAQSQTDGTWAGFVKAVGREAAALGRLNAAMGELPSLPPLPQVHLETLFGVPLSSGAVLGGLYKREGKETRRLAVDWAQFDQAVRKAAGGSADASRRQELEGDAQGQVPGFAQGKAATAARGLQSTERSLWSVSQDFQRVEESIAGGYAASQSATEAAATQSLETILGRLESDDGKVKAAEDKLSAVRKDCAGLSPSVDWPWAGLLEDANAEAYRVREVNDAVQALPSMRSNVGISGYVKSSGYLGASQKIWDVAGEWKRLAAAARRGYGTMDHQKNVERRQAILARWQQGSKESAAALFRRTGKDMALVREALRKAEKAALGVATDDERILAAWSAVSQEQMRRLIGAGF